MVNNPFKLTSDLLLPTILTNKGYYAGGAIAKMDWGGVVSKVPHFCFAQQQTGSAANWPKVLKTNQDQKVPLPPLVLPLTHHELCKFTQVMQFVLLCFGVVPTLQRSLKFHA